MFTRDKTTLKSIAHQNEATTKPGTIPAASQTIKAFIKKVNNPKVNKLSGSVKRIMNGLTKTFRIPNTIATTTATQNVGIVIPADNIYAATNTANDLIKSSMIIFIFLLFNL